MTEAVVIALLTIAPLEGSTAVRRVHPSRSQQQGLPPVSRAKARNPSMLTTKCPMSSEAATVSSPVTQDTCNLGAGLHSHASLSQTFASSQNRTHTMGSL